MLLVLSPLSLLLWLNIFGIITHVTVVSLVTIGGIAAAIIGTVTEHFDISLALPLMIAGIIAPITGNAVWYFQTSRYCFWYYCWIIGPAVII